MAKSELRVLAKWWVRNKELQTEDLRHVPLGVVLDRYYSEHAQKLPIAVLVAGDQDYVPLVRAVRAEGARVHVWFVSSGLDDLVRREADYFKTIDPELGV